MLARVRSGVSYANVMATIAVFAALGGGYATAFSGDGTLQKASSVPTSSFTDARTLTGFGALQWACIGTGDAVGLRFRNTTDSSVVMDVDNDLNLRSNTAPHDVGEAISFGGDQEAELHIWKVGTDKKAQVVVNIRVSSDGNFCQAGKILALNTQE